MKDFFSEYGRLIIVGALVICLLMFSTPFGTAITTSICGFANGMHEKTMLSINGDSLTYKKGDTVTLTQLGFDNGEALGNFRILDISGPNDSEIKLLKIGSIASGRAGWSSDYDGSILDRNMTTYYESLPENIRNAIIPKEIVQSAYDGSTRVGEKAIGERYIYAPDIDDYVEYYGHFPSTSESYGFTFAGVSNYWTWTRSTYRTNTIYQYAVNPSGSFEDKPCEHLEDTHARHIAMFVIDRNKAENINHGILGY